MQQLKYVLIGLLITLTGWVKAQTISLSPNNADAGDMLTVTISGVGTNFSVASTTQAKIEQGDYAIPIAGEAASQTSFNGVLEIPGDAPSGSYNATIYQTGNAGTFWSCANCFTINAGCQVAISGMVTNGLCFGDSTGSIDLSVTGANNPTFVWSNGATSEDIGSIPSGQYSVTVTDGACIEEDTFFVSEPSPLDVSTSITNLSAMGASDGAINLSVIGGTPPYSYAWSTGGTTVTIDSLSGGTYDVTVMDANTCSVNISIEIAAFTCTLSATLVGTNLSCNGDSSGTIDLTIDGGNAPYMITWQDDVPAIEDRENLAAGTYTVMIRDQDGCELTDSITLVEPIALDASFLSTQSVCSEPFEGTISLVEVTGNQGPFVVTWPDGLIGDSMVQIDQPGDYSIMVTDTVGCQFETTVVLDTPTMLTILFDSVIVNADSTFTLVITPGGGSGIYAAEWTDSTGQIVSIDLNPTVQNPGIYSVTVFDENGCSVTLDSILIEEITTSLVNHELAENVRIWPTIVKKQIQIILPNLSAFYDVQLFSLDGIPIKRFRLSSGLHQIDIGNVGSGMYILAFANQEGIATKKIIVTD